ncbi:hypothetical protein PRZ48_011293 [Zasmidium cellare]|uniref:Threonylcarbamoyl-AMP synthase n=1 Tax=Zasmidium cellare TaxID=395010 RepID=A0ABR0E697_ZASCE|nr:hypothetical protein PRZ48_011293 [Zasmidium cellare]
MSPSASPPQIPNIKADALRAFNVLQKGGLAIVPFSVGYAITATDPAALQRAFETKQRKPHKRHAMIGSYALHKEIHVLPEREAGMVELLTKTLDMPLGVVAPFRREHPLIEKLGEELLARSSMDGTLSMLVNGGPFQDELSRLAVEAGVPLMGSSANVTGKGTKSFAEDIEPEILAVADIVIDYGKMKYVHPRPSSTMINFKDVSPIRFGACYDAIKDVMKRFYDIDFPEDPGRTYLFSGHLGKEANTY